MMYSYILFNKEDLSSVIVINSGILSNKGIQRFKLLESYRGWQKEGSLLIDISQWYIIPLNLPETFDCWLDRQEENC